MTDQPDKTLAEKLEFAPGDTVFVETTPGWYTQFADDAGVELEPTLPATHAHIFCRSRSELAAFLHENDLPHIEKSLWVSWPKKTGSIGSDLDDQKIREAVLPTGWVDTKVISIDDDWSALKFLRRKS
jgi:hypothetical protein